jgi:integrase
MRFHDLRHYFASYLHDKGFSDAEIMSLGGWKTDHVMKRVYRHAIKDKTNDKIKEVMKELI